MIQKVFTKRNIYAFIACAILIPPSINLLVYLSSRGFITNDSTKLSQKYTVIVPGARAYSLRSLSPILEDRLAKAYHLYSKKLVKRFLLTGDHGQKNYDEVNAMRVYLLNKGVKESDIFLDHAGFNTYDSLFRAKAIFKVDNAIIVTQGYHLYRAVYIARKLGINAQGYRADRRRYLHIRAYKARELLAIVKSYLETWILRSPRYLGESIPITGNSKLSWD